MTRSGRFYWGQEPAGFEFGHPNSAPVGVHLIGKNRLVPMREA